MLGLKYYMVAAPGKIKHERGQHDDQQKKWKQYKTTRSQLEERSGMAQVWCGEQHNDLFFLYRNIDSCENKNLRWQNTFLTGTGRSNLKKSAVEDYEKSKGYMQAVQIEYAS